jgi:hypothetical protein
VSWTTDGGALRQVIGTDSPLIRDFERIPNFGWSLVRQLSPVFCVPPNKDLLELWNRVEDRLWKIRNCRDITGAERQLALFAPEIDPRLLVRAVAAGLSIDEVLSGSGGELPPYRFSYLIDKAKQYAATVQGFGSQLFSALEKRDGEELNLLRSVQQQNLLKMSTRMRQDDIKAASEAVEAVRRQISAAQFRHDYYSALRSTGLTAWETTQQISRHATSVLQGAAGVTDTIAGIASSSRRSGPRSP